MNRKRNFLNHQDSHYWHHECWLDGWIGFHINPTNSCWDISQKEKVAVGWRQKGVQLVFVCVVYKETFAIFRYNYSWQKEKSVLKSLEVIIVEEGLLTGAGWESHFGTAATVQCHTLHVAAMQVMRVGSQFHRNIEHFEELKQTNKQDQKNQMHYIISHTSIMVYTQLFW